MIDDMIVPVGIAALVGVAALGGGGIEIQHGVQTIDINLPMPSYGDVRQGFVAMFNGASSKPENPYTAALEAARKQQDDALNNA